MNIGDLQKPLLPVLSPTSEARLDAAQKAGHDGRTEESARQFEHLFATLLVRELRRAMPQGPFGDGPGKDVYEGWFDEHLGNALAERDALGIARLVQNNLGRAPEAHEGDARTQGEVR